MASIFDPLDVNARLYRQVAALLEQLEDKDSFKRVTLRERVTALVAIGRIQTLFVGLRKEKGADEHTGASVRKYATAFGKPHDAGGRKKVARSRAAALPKPEPEPDPPADWFERDDDDDLGSDD